MQLKRNRQLDSFFVRNLNLDPQGWALEDKSIDSVLCCVSVQYLQQVVCPSLSMTTLSKHIALVSPEL